MCLERKQKEDGWFGGAVMEILGGEHVYSESASDIKIASRCCKINQLEIIFSFSWIQDIERA